MTQVLACLDGSAYGDSVCDYAAWLAGRVGGPLRLLHASGDQQGAGTEPLAAGRAHLADQGVAIAGAHVVRGSFVESCVTQASRGWADMIVVGKRGLGSAPDARSLGGCVAPLVRAVDRPVLLASRTFLPVFSVVALLDADPAHHGAVDFLCDHPDIAGPEVQVVISAPPGHAPAEKLAAVRARLAGTSAGVFSIEASGIDPTAAEVIEARGADLIIISRAVLSIDDRQDLRLFEDRGLWGWRTPILIC